MTRNPRKLLSTLLVVILLFSLFTTMPLSASAAGADALKSTIVSFVHGGTGSLSATVSGSTVTVAGSVADATKWLILNIDSGVTVRWEADYSGSDTALIRLNGSGTFEVAQGGSIIKTTGGSVIMVEGGQTNSVVVSGGTVSGKNGSIISSSNAGASVTVSGGTVESTQGNGTAISTADGNINVTGGTISTVGSGATISCRGTLAISGGKVINKGTGVAIMSYGDDSLVNVTGGEVEAGGGQTISLDNNMTMSGGTVRNTGSNPAIITSGKLTISGGTMCATTSYAIGTNGVDYVTKVTGGFVFAYGTNTVRAKGDFSHAPNHVIDGFSGVVEISSNGIVCAWNQAAGNTQYSAGSTSDLIAYPSGASVKWSKSGSQSGISYSINGANVGFFPIDGVTVESSASAPYFITQPSNVTVEEGGTAIFTVEVGGDGPFTYDWQYFEYDDWFHVPNENGNPILIEGDLTVILNNYRFRCVVTGANGSATSNEARLSVTSSSSTTGMSNFVKLRTYTSGMFTDVNENLWYGTSDQKVIANVYEYGLMQGNSVTTFNPTGNITIAEALAVASRVHNIYNGGDGVFVQGNPWYKVYVDYTINNHIITETAFSQYNKAATRAEMVYIFSNAIPSSEFTSQNTVNNLPDVIAGTPYRDEILMLYMAGVLTGSDTQGTFNPGNNITRAEAAAIISRIILPTTRASGRTYG